jgi:hypothetical protein
MTLRFSVQAAKGLILKKSYVPKLHPKYVGAQIWRRTINS